MLPFLLQFSIFSCFDFPPFGKHIFAFPPIVPSCNASATFLLPPFSCLNVSPAPPGVKFYIASKIVIDFYRFYDSSSGWIFPAFNVQSGPSSGEILKKIPNNANVNCIQTSSKRSTYCSKLVLKKCEHGRDDKTLKILIFSAPKLWPEHLALEPVW